MTRLLSLFGLMRVSEHEKLIDNSVTYHLRNYSALGAKYKRAVADLEKQAGDIARLCEEAHRDGVRYNELASDRDNWRRECLDLRPDAEAMRRKRQMDRDRRKGNG